MGGGGSKVGTELDDDDDLPKETEADKQDPDNKCLVVEPDFGGPCKKRRCTDCLCLLLLGTCWFVMTYIGLALCVRSFVFRLLASPSSRTASASSPGRVHPRCRDR